MLKKYQPVLNDINPDTCHQLALKYHSKESFVLQASKEVSPETFLRYFITFHGIKPHGRWTSHTYLRVEDSITKRDQYFLAPNPLPGTIGGPDIRVEAGLVIIDDITTNFYPQEIPYTTPFWYFHYNPNREKTPYYSATLNFSPSCSENCTLCAGAKTGRVNNGQDETLLSEAIIGGIFQKYPAAAKQLENIAIVTGCFDSFSEMITHLKDVKASVSRYASPKTYTVLEHNISSYQQFEYVVGELGYDVLITLECFDQEMRNLALNGKVGRKGRDSREFVTMANNYAHFLNNHPELGKEHALVTYLMGIDSLQVTEDLFTQLSTINKRYQNSMIMPWMSIFTPYTEQMRRIRRPEFSLEFLFRARKLAENYFGKEQVETFSGTTQQGYARGLY